MWWIRVTRLHEKSGIKIPSNTVPNLQKGLHSKSYHVHLYTHITKCKKLILCKTFCSTEAGSRWRCIRVSIAFPGWILSDFSLNVDDWTSCSWLLKGTNAETFQSQPADILAPPPLCLLPPSSIQAFTSTVALRCPAASLPSPHLSCLINCQGSCWAYAKACIPPPAWSGIGIPLLLNVWKRKDVLIYSSMLDEATANL